MSKKKKFLLSLLLMNCLLLPKIIDARNLNNLRVSECSSEGYMDYSNGCVYIGDREYINSIKDIVEPDDILVVDERSSDDPNMQVQGSYRIHSRRQKLEILSILQMYEDEYPTEWSRTLEGMRLEWEVHNMLYMINYELDHTTDVDFNNEDACYYEDVKILRKELKKDT